MLQDSNIILIKITQSQELEFQLFGPYKIGFFGLQNRRKNSMQEDLLVSDCPPKMGDLLHCSLWRRDIQSQGEATLIYEKCVQYDKKYLNFTYDLRFTLNEDTLTFTLFQKQITFQVVSGDENACRNVLKSRLNQNNFYDHYRAMKKIGKGSFASVYQVQSIVEGVNYAAKAFSKEAAYSEDKGKQCLMKQIDIMRQLSGPHNLKLSQVFQSDNSLYLVLQLLQGGQLYNKIKTKKKFKPHQIRKIVRGILEGLREMHQKRIMHRDLKPENILLRSEDGDECVIADYGLAQFVDKEEWLFVRCGTPGYVAPEIINIKDTKARYSPNCDIFSLGLIFHLLLFGKSLFRGKTYNQILTENRLCNFNLFGPQYQQVDEIVMDLLRKMLKINPEQRITADQALKHRYFNEQQQTQQNQLDIFEALDRVVDIGESPILTMSSQKKQIKNIKKDSCLQLKMGKENILNGTQVVGSRISGLLKGLGVSKFVKAKDKYMNA